MEHSNFLPDSVNFLGSAFALVVVGSEKPLGSGLTGLFYGNMVVKWKYGI